PERGPEGLLRHPGRSPDWQDRGRHHPGRVISDPTIRPAIEQVAQAAPSGAACRRPAPSERIETPDAFDCQACGACCSYSAEWPRLSLESDAHIARIPRELIDDGERGMRCTGDRCAALVGVVGQ